MGYVPQEDDEWDWKFHRYCENMELTIYDEYSKDNYYNFNWDVWFSEKYDACEYFDELFIFNWTFYILEDDDDSVSGEVDSVGSY